MNVAHVLATLRAQADAADPIVVYAAAIALGVLTWTLLQALVRATSSSSKHPPVYRPKSTLPILGNTLDAYFQQHRFFDWLVDESTASGTKPWVMSILGRPPTYVLCTPEAFEDVFKTHVSVFEKGPAASFTFKDFLGEGIIAVDGHKWFTQRKTASHLFSMQMMRDVMEHVVSEKALLVHSILKDCVARKQQVAMAELFSKLSSDVFGRVGFGVDLNCLANPFTTTPDHAFIEAIKSGAHTLQLRFQQPMWLWRLQRFLSIGHERQTKKDIKVLNDLVRTIIFKSMQNKNDAIAAAQRAEAVAGDRDAAKAAERSKGKDLLSLFLDTGDHTDVNFMRDMVINFFAAGKDTTTLNMSWFILMMNRYPDVAAKVRAELATQLPDVVSGAKPVPTAEDLSKLVYLEAALRESMRLNNSMTSRCANADVTLSDGTFIPKDANLIISIYVCSRMKSVWGEDAAEYKPERWIDPATGKLIRFSPYKDITFLVGPRQCIGMRFALLQMKTVLAMIMSQFDVKTVEDPFQVTYEFSFIMAIGSKLVSDISDAPRSSTMAAAVH